MTWRVLTADCVRAMRWMAPNSVDAVVCDPPYGLGFMGREWDSFAETPNETRWNVRGRNHDVTPGSLGGVSGATFAQPNPRCAKCGKVRAGHPDRVCRCEDFEPSARPNRQAQRFQAWCEAWATEVFRVLKPGGHLLAFGGTRTYHRLASGIEDAGFEVRDCLAWLYGSGFPKSHDVSKAIDKRGGKPHLAAEIGAAIKAARIARGMTANEADRAFCGGSTNWSWFEGRKGECRPPTPATFARIVEAWPELATYADAVAEAEREVVAQSAHASGIGNGASDHYTVGGTRAEVYDITAPATPDAERWQGWGTALKPAHEPIIVARKPLAGTVAANVLEHGTGALNIDATRIKGAPPSVPQPSFGSPTGNVYGFQAGEGRNGEMSQASGRWPANVLLDAEAAAMLDAQTGTLTSNPGTIRAARERGDGWGMDNEPGRVTSLGDSGGASRFFYCAKASRRERNAGLDGFDERRSSKLGAGIRASVGRDVEGTTMSEDRRAQNHHPTVKPVDLMRWLCRLVTPPGGLVLDPFTGSGTTGVAAVLEGFRFVGLEQDAGYAEIARARIALFAERGEDALEQVRTLEAADAKRKAITQAGQLDLLGGDAA